MQVQTLQEVRKGVKVVAVNAVTNSAMESQADRTPAALARPRVIRAD